MVTWFLIRFFGLLLHLSVRHSVGHCQLAGWVYGWSPFSSTSSSAFAVNRVASGIKSIGRFRLFVALTMACLARWWGQIVLPAHQNNIKVHGQSTLETSMMSISQSLVQLMSKKSSTHFWLPCTRIKSVNTYSHGRDSTLDVRDICLWIMTWNAVQMLELKYVRLQCIYR